MSIGQRIAERRIRLGYSQRLLADKVGISQSMVTAIERGSRIPTMILGAKIAKELHCSILDFLD